MRRTALLLAMSVIASQGVAYALGVTPYLPLNLDPDIESQVERVLILGDEPAMTRPIPAALVLEALPKACRRDRPLCERVQHYLDRYMQTTGVEFTSLSAAATSGSSNITLPNQHGEKAQSAYEVAGAAYLQPNSYMLLNLGGVAYQGRATPTGTMLSLGFDWAQLDIGWRDHWWSPMTDSAMLISTEAPTMPSFTLSNYRPLTRLGLQYEAFVARMSESDRIQLPITGPAPQFTRGNPKMGGIRIAIAPVSGWELSAQRLIVWGGGAAGGQSITDILKAMFNPGRAQTAGFGSTSSAIGKQEASLTSRFIFPSRVPFSVYFEYAGNDTIAGKPYLVGKPDISVGIDFPRIGPFNLTYEVSSFAPTWYVHLASNVQTGYLDGITNYGESIGHWFGDQRVLATPNSLADQVGGQSNMLRIGWEPWFGGLMQLQLRALANEGNTLFASYPYKNEYLESLSYSYPWKGYSVGAQIDAGRDVFGEHYARLQGYLRDGDALLRGNDDTGAEAAASAGERAEGNELYVSVGADYYRTLINLNLASQPRYYTKSTVGPYFALGARRRVSRHQDLGVAVEADDISGRALLSVRMLDYRYRFNSPLAVNLFLGGSRYSVGTPAYGLYVGAGLQWRNLLPGWDVGVDYRNVIDAQRERDLSTDPEPLGSPKPDSFHTIYSWTLYLSRKF
ncbi:MAG TPA: capsule assembly Wzi family protein [Steroidobacteraceae bacterium]|nr:capsule assembly Wzi family protein [Steroidobacteraceae bacterium]